MSKWSDNDVQFPRLLAEIAANCELTDKMYEDLCASMNLQRRDIDQLFGRAQAQFEDILLVGAAKVRELGTVSFNLQDGEQEELAVVQELDTGNIFAIHASYAQQIDMVVSPYGNGQMEYDE